MGRSRSRSSSPIRRKRATVNLQQHATSSTRERDKSKRKRRNRSISRDRDEKKRRKSRWTTKVFPSYKHQSFKVLLPCSVLTSIVWPFCSLTFWFNFDTLTNRHWFNSLNDYQIAKQIPLIWQIQEVSFSLTTAIVIKIQNLWSSSRFWGRFGRKDRGRGGNDEDYGLLWIRHDQRQEGWGQQQRRSSCYTKAEISVST